MNRKVAIVTTKQPGTNPRVRKSADALSAAGFDVRLPAHEPEVTNEVHIPRADCGFDLGHKSCDAVPLVLLQLLREQLGQQTILDLAVYRPEFLDRHVRCKADDMLLFVLEIGVYFLPGALFDRKRLQVCAQI